MKSKKTPPIEIVRLAQDLGLRIKTDPFTEIIEYALSQVDKWHSEAEDCNSLSHLLEWVAGRLRTSFREIHSAKDLKSIKTEFCEKGEIAFANLPNELSEGVFGITYSLQNAQKYEPQFVSIIDCRGVKSFRSYFTKWHELAHLLTLTNQGRLIFRRTHSSISRKDPAENLMDVIAGRAGFYSEIFHKKIKGEISFSEIERLRLTLCPESSKQAALISFVKYWPSPCIRLEVGMGLNKGEKESLKQGAFSFMDQPEKVLRALYVEPNEKAREINFRLFSNMRVPETSIIYKAYVEGLESAEAAEDSAIWGLDNGQDIKVKVRKFGNSIDALICPV